MGNILSYKIAYELAVPVYPRFYEVDSDMPPSRNTGGSSTCSIGEPRRGSHSRAGIYWCGARSDERALRGYLSHCARSWRL